MELKQLTPLTIDCLTDNMRLVVDEKTGRASNSPGVETRIPNFGSTTSFEVLDPAFPDATAVFRNMVE